jgi:uncharacterized protein (UPF0248 family)
LRDVFEINAKKAVAREAPISRHVPIVAVYSCGFVAPRISTLGHIKQGPAEAGHYRLPSGIVALMLPLDRLLHRIKWDPAFGKGAFALGYYDRVLAGERVVPFSSVTFDGERPGMFTFTDPDGVAHHIPLHRARTVYKDGAIIWRRAATRLPGGDDAHS